MTYRDNEVNFACGQNPGLTGATFTITDYSISSGQDPQKKIYDNLVTVADSGINLNFEIGRKGSPDVANWFSNKIKPNENTFNSNPGDLNFALFGTLTLSFGGPVAQKYTFSNIMLAQGKSGSTNNWWFGGQNCTNKSNHTVSCNDDDNTTSFSFCRGGVDAPTVNQIIVSYKIIQ